jgi:DEAD/DEAH box helicase domain-containing protein
VLRLLLAREPLPALDTRSSARLAEDSAAAAAPEETPGRHRIVYVDIETQRGADDVGGWHNAHLMRVAVAVIYDEIEARFETFEEADVPALLERLEAADLVIRRFDYAVLRGYTDRDLTRLPTFDMLDAIHRQLGFRLPLGHLAQETLGTAKSADGLQSLRWWKQGRVDLISAYCRQDVALLRDLLRHAEEHGHLFFRTREGHRVRLPARWHSRELVERARASARPSAAGYPGVLSPGAVTR